LAKIANPEYSFLVGDISVPLAKAEFAVLKSVLEHQESLDDALMIYDSALRSADTVLVGWHTPPIYPETTIITVQAELENPIYQNHYKAGSFDREDVRVEKTRMGEFELWVASH